MVTAHNLSPWPEFKAQSSGRATKLPYFMHLKGRCGVRVIVLPLGMCVSETEKKKKKTE